MYEEIAYLAVKVKSLSAESRIIRRDEAKLRVRQAVARERGNRPLADSLRSTRLGLAEHRRRDVRQASRSSQLAYGFLRGVPYGAMEGKCWTPPDWNRVAKDVVRFGHGGDAKALRGRLDEWAAVPPVPRAKPVRPAKKPFVRAA